MLFDQLHWSVNWYVKPFICLLCLTFAYLKHLTTQTFTLLYFILYSLHHIIITGMIISVTFLDYTLTASVFAIMLILIPVTLFCGFFRPTALMDWYIAKMSMISFYKESINSLLIATYGLNRCEYELQQEWENFVQRNSSSNSSIERPNWITSLSTLIDYQVRLAEKRQRDLNKNSSIDMLNTTPSIILSEFELLEPEEKLVRFMRLNSSEDSTGSVNGTGTVKLPLVLEHFGLQSNYDAFWHEIYFILIYILILAIILYVLMLYKFNRKK